MIYYLAALGAALSWAVSAIISANPSTALGSIAFVRIRMTMVFFMLAAVLIVSGGWRSVEAGHITPTFISGLVGILLGDAALFASMNRLGPRRAGILFSSNAVFSVILGWMFLGEKLGIITLTGITIALTGVAFAILFGKRSNDAHQWEAVKGSLATGIAIGLFSGLCQAIGSIVVRPVMETGVDPVAVAAIRVGIASLGLTIAMYAGVKAARAQTALTPKLGAQVALSGFAAMGVGMTLLLFALRGGNVGIIATLSATTPALVLPLLWWKTGDCPPMLAWLGAGLVVVGSGLIFAA
ncbi:MAG: DMT family transporter [Rhizobiaceae bacterium]